MTDSAEAADALSAMRDSQARLAKAAACPPERHLTFAGLMGVCVAAPAAPYWAMLGLEALLLVAVVFVIRWDRRRTGMFVNSYRRGRTRPVILALLAAMIGLYATGYWLAKAQGVFWAPLALAPIAMAGAYYGGVWWQRVYTRELGVAA